MLQTFDETLQRLKCAVPEKLAAMDIAEMNLLCAHGLPGAESLDISRDLRTIAEWTAHVRSETERIFPIYLRNPDPKKGSEAVYRLWAVIKTLKDAFGLKHYLMPEKGTGKFGTFVAPPVGEDPGFKDSEPLFLHGLLGPRRIGSCSSLPVLFVAVARRLGYPVHLVLTVQHMYIRWESAEESFNMDGSGPDFINIHPFEFYVDKPRKWRDEELNCESFRRIATPAEALGAFLLTRAGCLRHNGYFNEAIDACTVAHNLAPGIPAFLNELTLSRMLTAIRSDWQFPQGMRPYFNFQYSWRTSR